MPAAVFTAVTPLLEIFFGQNHEAVLIKIKIVGVKRRGSVWIYFVLSIHRLIMLLPSPVREGVSGRGRGVFAPSPQECTNNPHSHSEFAPEDLS